MTQSTHATTFSFVIERSIKATRERVFDALTKPEHLYLWWAAHEGYTTVLAEVDLRVGGAYRLGMQDPTQEHPFVVGGLYREVSRPGRLVFTWKWRVPPRSVDWIPPDTLVTIDLFDRGGVTDVRLTHEMFPDQSMCDEHNRGWDGCIDSLVHYLSSP